MSEKVELFQKAWDELDLSDYRKELDLKTEYINMKAWVQVNKPKKLWGRFIMNWLKKSLNQSRQLREPTLQFRRKFNFSDYDGRVREYINKVTTKWNVRE